MRIDELKPAEGSNKKTRRVGRGVGSGRGKTAGKGHKGQKARTGGATGRGFEGGQMPMQRRLPKRGFRNAPFSREFAILNLKDLSKISDLDVITPEVLHERGIVKDLRDGLKILGNGEISRPLTVKANAFSSSALKKIASAGGKTEVV